MKNQLKSKRAFWDRYDHWIFCKICVKETKKAYAFLKAFKEEYFFEMFFTRVDKVFRKLLIKCIERGISI